MRRNARAPWDLVGAFALLLAADALVLRDVEGPLRAVVALAALLFSPGYALACALFPERGRRLEVGVGEGEERGVRVERAGLGGVERAALSVGLSVALVPLAGLALDLSPWGIGVAPLLGVLTAASLLASAAALWRRARTPPARVFAPSLRVDLSAWRASSPVDKALAAGVALSLLAAGGAVGYALLQPRADAEPFTELYVVPADADLAAPAAPAQPGEPVTVRIGVGNHEGRPVAYAVRVLLVEGAWRTTPEGGRAFDAGGAALVGQWQASVQDGATDERSQDVVLPLPGVYKLEVELRRPGDEAPYRSAHLFLEAQAPTG